MGSMTSIELSPLNAKAPEALAGRLDRLGAGLSFACAIHCALQPLLLVLLPFIGLGFILDERLETAFLAFSIVLASATILGGWRHHRQPQALPLLPVAVGLIVSSRLPQFAAWEIPLAVGGALSIMSAHLYNLRLHRRAHGDHHHGRPEHHACETQIPCVEAFELCPVAEVA